MKNLKLTLAFLGLSVAFVGVTAVPTNKLNNVLRILARDTKGAPPGGETPLPKTVCGYECQPGDDVWFPDPDDCSKFFSCNDRVLDHHECPFANGQKLYFDNSPDLKFPQCVWPHEFKGKCGDGCPPDEEGEEDTQVPAEEDDGEVEGDQGDDDTEDVIEEDQDGPSDGDDHHEDENNGENGDEGQDDGDGDNADDGQEEGVVVTNENSKVKVQLRFNLNLQPNQTPDVGPTE